jgi:hypothetical protein
VLAAEGSTTAAASVVDEDAVVDEVMRPLVDGSTDDTVEGSKGEAIAEPAG